MSKSGRKPGSSTPSPSATAGQHSNTSPLTSSVSPSATIASSPLRMVRSLSSTKNQPLIRSGSAHCLPKSSFAGFFSTSCQTDLSRCATTVCSVPATANCSTRPESGSALTASNQTQPRETAEQKLTAVACCPNCGTVLTLIRELKPRTDLPP
jgi:hypothetical protein